MDDMMIGLAQVNAVFPKTRTIDVTMLNSMQRFQSVQMASGTVASDSGVWDVAVSSGE